MLLIKVAFMLNVAFPNNTDVTINEATVNSL